MYINKKAYWQQCSHQSKPLLDYRIRFNATPGFYFSNLIFGWGSIQILLTWGCIRDGVLLINSSFASIIYDNFSQTLKVKRMRKCHFYMITKKPRFQALLIYTGICIITHFMMSIYLKNAKVGMSGVVFKLGFYCFNTISMTGVVLGFEWGEVLFKSGVTFKRIR